MNSTYPRNTVIPLLILATALFAILCSGGSAKKENNGGYGTSSFKPGMDVTGVLFQCL